MLATNGNGRAHPSVLEAEVVRLRQANARLRNELAAVQGVAGLVPTEYASAIGFAAFSPTRRRDPDGRGREGPGAFRVTEGSRPPMSGDASEAESVSRFCQDNAGATCTSKLIHLSSTVAAGLLYGPNGPTSVTWIERFGATTYRFVVMGPPSTFTPDIATRVSTEVAAGFAPNG